jgi:amino acid transporter
MSNWRRHLELTIKSKTGLSTGVLMLGIGVLLGATLALVFFLLAAYMALAERYSPSTAALLLGGLFLLVTIVALLCCLSSQRRTIAGAKLALAAHSHAPWLDAKYLGVGLQIGRAIGWRRLVPIAAVGILAAGIAKEWLGRNPPARETS